jgi:hypothetical protein
LVDGLDEAQRRGPTPGVLLRAAQANVARAHKPIVGSTETVLEV